MLSKLNKPSTSSDSTNKRSLSLRPTGGSSTSTSSTTSSNKKLHKIFRRIISPCGNGEQDDDHDGVYAQLREEEEVVNIIETETPSPAIPILRVPVPDKKSKPKVSIVWKYFTFPRRKLDILLSVEEFLELSPRENPCKDNKPGRKWNAGFLKRNPDLSERTPEAVSAASATVAEPRIRKWFKDVEEILIEESHFDILKHPDRVFNGDESGFLLNPASRSKVLAPLGAKNVYEGEKGQCKVSVTVMFTFSASGAMVPPMIIFPGKRLRKDVLNSVPETWGIGRSESGWMRAEVFYEYVANVFHPFLIENKIQKPVILFVDGHKSHLTYQLSALCQELDIVLVSLYPNATRILQPADVSCFRPLKEGWRNAVCEWASKHPGHEINLQNFASILKIAISKYVKPQTAQNGFKACGLCPWDANAVDYSKCLSNYAQEEDEVCTADFERKLSLNTFKNLMGENLLEKIAENCRDEYTTEDVIAGVKRVYQFLNPQATICDAPELVHDENYATSSVQEIMQVENVVLRNAEEGTDGINPTSTNDKSTLSDNTTENALPSTSSSNVNAKESSFQDETIGEACSSKSCDNRATSHSTTGLNVKKCLFPDRKGELKKGSNANVLATVLHWPESPKKKCKRVIKKMSYVITCSKWKSLTESKLQEQQADVERKEIKKRERQEKKEKAEADKKRKQVERKKKNKSAEPSTSRRVVSRGLCYKCGKNISGKQSSSDCSSCLTRRLHTCDKCHKPVYFPCAAS